MSTDSFSSDGAERQLRRACAELDRGLRAGGSTSAETLLATFPDVAADADLAVELIYSEYLTLESLGRPPAASDYCIRFPQWSDRLSRLFQVDGVLKDWSARDAFGGTGKP